MTFSDSLILHLVQRWALSLSEPVADRPWNVRGVSVGMGHEIWSHLEPGR